jgi:glycosyltransferase involved in cell wall biosynthesis
MASRVALLTPFGPPAVHGNAVTVARIARGLVESGVDVRIWDLSIVPEEVVEREVAVFRPALVHAFHAYRTGPLALRLARRAGVPLIVTITGTDANHDLADSARASTVRDVLAGAAAVVTFHAAVSERIEAALPDLGPRLATVPQAVRFEGQEPFDLDARWTLPAEAVLFLFPAGLRPVKRPRLPLAPLGRLVMRYPALRLCYAGPIVDAAEGQALSRALAGLGWARHVGIVPHGAMPSLLARAAVVLNCSVSEGGMANSVLEALALGCAVLASDIPGNRSLIEDGVTGLLFRDEQELQAGAERLVRDPALRARLGANGRGLVESRYRPERETEGYLRQYRRLEAAPSA